MNNIYIPFESYDNTHPRNFRTQSVQNEKGDHEPFTNLPTSCSSTTLMLACILQLLHERIDKTLFRYHHTTISSDEELSITLTHFKASLHILEVKDISTSGEYAETLSRSWHQLLRAIDFRVAKLRQVDVRNKLLSFLEVLNHFPQNADHSFGYYLSHYAGRSWLPLPFIELLKFLHEDALINGEKGTLSQWIELLREILLTIRQ